ncbi:hypothetical protein C8J57DRAFT_1217402 [Mycena rebaudengoi]|nr:hypothetical protein C8J57DRAFT_1217402 [Mycena rebaudengoi]
MVQFFSAFTAVVACVALVSASPTKKACTPMTNAELGALSDDAHNAIQAAATADHGSHSNNLVVNDPDVNSFLVYALNVFLTLELHKFPGSPASVCDNLATGTVWVEYNDSGRTVWMLFSRLSRDGSPEVVWYRRLN